MKESLHIFTCLIGKGQGATRFVSYILTLYDK